MEITKDDIKHIQLWCGAQLAEKEPGATYDESRIRAKLSKDAGPSRGYASLRRHAMGPNPEWVALAEKLEREKLDRQSSVAIPDATDELSI